MVVTVDMPAAVETLDIALERTIVSDFFRSKMLFRGGINLKLSFFLY